MKKNGGKFLSLFLIFSLVILSGNIMAQEKNGAKLVVMKNDGQQVTGELITVKKDSLLLLETETQSDLSVDIKDVNTIKIIKKKPMLGMGLGGLMLGAVARGVMHSNLEKDEDDPAFAPKVHKTFTWAGIGGAIGIVAGAILGMNKTIRIQGRSDSEIISALEDLSKKARVPNFQ